VTLEAKERNQTRSPHPPDPENPPTDTGLCQNTHQLGHNQCKRKTRRSKQKAKDQTSQLKIWYSNINGIISKKDSLQTILNSIQPHIVVLTETKTQTNPKIEGYQWKATCKSNKGGGVTIATRNDISNNAKEIELEKIDKMDLTWIS